ncbi:hypothetical protein B0H10DRAFT_1975169 [Mycena sp. CBHHK59/15]|nr:hypothetical protein B0H10DRAFT_1975169 [Mycena sp. CBHHK59/15]
MGSSAWQECDVRGPHPVHGPQYRRRWAEEGPQGQGPVRPSRGEVVGGRTKIMGI